MNKYIKYLFIIFMVLFLAALVAIEILHVSGPVDHLSSKEYTIEVIRKLGKLSAIYQFLIIFMFFLLAYAFISVFKLLTGPLVGGKLYKVIPAVILYLLCLVICIRGYSVIINADYNVNLTGKITEHFYQTAWPHFMLLIFIFLAKYIEHSIKKDIEKDYEIVRNTKNRYNNYDEYKEIISEHNKKI